MEVTEVRTEMWVVVDGVGRGEEEVSVHHFVY